MQRSRLFGRNSYTTSVSSPFTAESRSLTTLRCWSLDKTSISFLETSFDVNPRRFTRICCPSGRVPWKIHLIGKYIDMYAHLHIIYILTLYILSPNDPVCTIIWGEKLFVARSMVAKSNCVHFEGPTPSVRRDQGFLKNLALLLRVGSDTGSALLGSDTGSLSNQHN